MNAFFDTGAEGFATKQVSWTADTINAALLDNTFVPTYDSAGNIDNASFWSDISSALVGLPVTLTGKSATAGVLAASDILFAAVTGNTVVRLVVYQDTGSPATSLLLLAYDSAHGIPIVPSGGDINVHWDTGVFKIAQL